MEPASLHPAEAITYEMHIGAVKTQAKFATFRRALHPRGPELGAAKSTRDDVQFFWSSLDAERAWPVSSHNLKTNIRSST